MKTKSLVAVWVCLLFVFLCSVSAQNLLINGDFEQELSIGWTQSQGGSGYKYIDRDSTYHPDPDFEARCYLVSGSGWAKLSQTVDVPSANLDLNFWANFGIGGGSSTCWPVAAVFVEYYDLIGSFLGETRIYYHNAYCNWRNTPTCHLIDVTNPDWQQYELNIMDEISNNLPGVNSAEVKKVGVSLYDYTSGG